MLVSLFSVFDPVSFFFVNLNWLMMGAVWVFCSVSFSFYVNSEVALVLRALFQELAGIFKDMTGSAHLGLVCVSVVFFLTLFVSNVFSLFPFVFSMTAHPMITMGLGVTVWASFFVFGWVTNYLSMAAHLVPCGCPLGLAPFMVLIESISTMIRPFTLSIRLAANMMAGHLIIGLLSSISLNNFSGFFMSILFQNVLMGLELGVSVIQSFVFSALILLYVVESY